MPYGSQEEAYRNASTMAHLTAEQALADYAVLITELKKNLSSQGCSVVLFGGSYGGSNEFFCSDVLINAITMLLASRYISIQSIGLLMRIPSYATVLFGRSN